MTDVDRRLIVPLDDLAHTEHSHEFVGDEHDGVPFSLILIHAGPGIGPRLHTHPYPEVFVVESGQATFRLDEDEVTVREGHLVVAPSGVPHGFTNTGDSELRMVAIHGSGHFVTMWLTGRDPVWASQPD